MIKEEQETTVTTYQGAPDVRIYTAQRKHITRLRKHPLATETRSGFYEGSEWAEFTVPESKWNPVSGIKRATSMTPEQKLAASERLRKVREGEGL